MKQNRMINILFIFIVCVLVGLGILGFLLPTITSHRPALHLTPTIDVAGSVDQTLQAYYSATKTATPTPTLIPPTSTLPPPTATATSIPSENYITNFVARKQSYSIGCEASAAVDLAGYFDVPFLQYDFQMALPKSDNPDLGFVGDVNSPWGQIPPDAYGVYASPVADLLNTYGVPVEGGKGLHPLIRLRRNCLNPNRLLYGVIGKMEYSEPC